MVNQYSTRMRELALVASEALAEVPGIESVCIFGSVARGTATRESDIDILVIGIDDSIDSPRLYDYLPITLSGTAVSISYHTQQSLRTYIKKWSRFGAHLQIESWTTFDPNGVLLSILADNISVSVVDELNMQRQYLSNYERVERFGGRMLFPLAHIYSIGRTVVFALLAERGKLNFDRNEAFDQLVAVEPDCMAEAMAVRNLGPFYNSVRNQIESPTLPFNPVGHHAEERFLEARDAVFRLLHLSVS